jgi:site-specific DNA-methyltransferase (adenine-specific)
MDKVLFSRKSDEWTTPKDVLDALCREFLFTLDPCSTRANALCELHYTLAEDGLTKDWAEHVVFMNPPYSNVNAWMRKAYESSRAGATVICLVPARTDTRWFHEFATKGEIRLYRGRLRFGDSRNSAPFPSCVVIFRPPTFSLSATK